MLLLIFPENGARWKTYGREPVNFGNMKYTFWCFVIVLTCSYCASADMDLYPGPRYPQLTDPNIYDDLPISSNSYNSRLEEYEDNTKSDSVYDSQKSDDEDQVSARNTLDGILKFLYRKQNGNLDNVDKRRVFPRLLQEVRQNTDPEGYGDEDSEGDFNQKWLNEEIERNTQRILEKWQESSRKKIVDHLKNSYYHDSMKTPKYEPRHQIVEEDPAHFAYVPPDPRYYEKQGESITEAQPIAVPIPQANKPLHSEVINTSGKPIDAPLRRDRTYPENSSKIQYRHQDMLNGRAAGEVLVQPKNPDGDGTGLYIIAIVAGISAAATVGLIAVGIGWYNLQKHAKNATDVDYPAYGVTGPNKDVSPSNDRKLAQSAQMYHYQHQKQQIIAMEKAATGDRHGSVSEADTDEENEEGDYTVYECPGLAPTGEMEVKNPMYQDDPTPAQTPQIKQGNKE
ncbi:protein cab-1 isoform X1 [Harmonia axyridis]|uniref:protein cab-1 isoform X1 n=1 Tax=Harmonia axyridis TaxID=115357 RepID=UPI001E278795|nr:protein cab-1 isoform X1 [Harmonia axyridis]